MKDKIFTSSGIHHGQALVLVLIFLAVGVILSLTLFRNFAQFLHIGGRSIKTEQAFNLAEAGVNKALWSLNDTAGAYNGETNTALGPGVFTVTKNVISSSLVEITSTGYVPNSTNYQAKKTIKVQIEIGSETISFNYATQVGVGGLDMDSNAEINGNVYSNSNITGASNSRINGDAFAVGTISSPAPIISGTATEGAPPEPLPEFDEQEWKDAAESGGTITGDVTYTSGDHTLSAKKIDGNLTLNTLANLTLTGPVWVTGDFTMKSNTKLIPDEVGGSVGKVLVVDGKITLNSNSEILQTSASPPGFIMLVSTKTVGTAMSINSEVANGAYYALDGLIDMDSGATVYAIAADKLHLDSNAVLNYQSGLASAEFSSGPGGGWQIKSGTYQLI